MTGRRPHERRFDPASGRINQQQVLRRDDRKAAVPIGPVHHQAGTLERGRPGIIASGAVANSIEHLKARLPREGIPSA